MPEFEKMKKILKVIIFMLLIVCCTYMVYVHRRVIRAWLKGEALPKVPEGHCHGFCCGK